MKERKLGKGLDLLLGGGQSLPAQPAEVSTSESVPAVGDVEPSTDSVPHALAGKSRMYFEVPVVDLFPNKNQPRKIFDDASIDRLSQSIKSDGVVQPVLVRRVENRYEIIAGERRWRAAQRSGIEKIPAVLVEADDNRSIEIALVENIHRDDLTPIEKAKGLLEVIKRFDYTQDELADRIGLDRSTVANMVRLLDLPMDIQDAVSRGTISMGHARALLGVEGEREQRYLSKRVEVEGLSVRKLENIIRFSRTRRVKRGHGGKDPLITEIENRLREFFGTKVSLEAGRRRGRIVIDYYDNGQLGNILSKLGISV